MAGDETFIVTSELGVDFTSLTSNSLNARG